MIKAPCVKVIVFDLGRVLIDFDHRIAAKRISFFTDKTASQIYDIFFDSESTKLFEEGRISAKVFFLQVKNRLKINISYQDFVPIWNEIFFLSQKNLSVYELARKLKKNYRLAILSNINVLHFQYVKKNFPIFDIFEDVFVSYRLKSRKPNPLIYQKVLRALKISSANNVFYTDDRPELVACAKNLGINGVVFESPLQLKQALKKSGVNTN